MSVMGVLLLGSFGSALRIDKLSAFQCNLETLHQRAALSYNIPLSPPLHPPPSSTHSITFFPCMTLFNPCQTSQKKTTWSSPFLRCLVFLPQCLTLTHWTQWKLKSFYWPLWLIHKMSLREDNVIVVRLLLQLTTCSKNISRLYHGWITYVGKTNIWSGFNISPQVIILGVYILEKDYSSSYSTFSLFSKFNSQPNWSWTV